jgi:hypothetical protein
MYVDSKGYANILARLIAVMLGRLKMSVAECIAAYTSLSDDVFRKTQHRVKINGQIQGRFDGEELTRAIKRIIRQQGLSEDALLKDVPEAGCKVWVFSHAVQYVLIEVALSAQQAKGQMKRFASLATVCHAAIPTY